MIVQGNFSREKRGRILLKHLTLEGKEKRDLLCKPKLPRRINACARTLPIICPCPCTAIHKQLSLAITYGMRMCTWINYV